ncbi:MAG: redoxin domain-containing protein [Erysipelotrichaceae bacterium]|nr:redoxin domain-containing protein [Erysipelotrichaceae bacterium]
MGNYLALFIEGVLSFFSPCVLPVIPLYMGYLTQGSKSVDENGNTVYKKSTVLLTTLFFVLGISTVFFVIALSVSSLQSITSKYSVLFSLFSGIILLFFGLIAMKVIEIPFLNVGFNLPFKINLNKMNFLTAYLLGFLFSFSWSPCVGPLLASAILKAANAASRVEGFIYIGFYTLGFIFMFLLLGLFTETILSILKKYQNVVNKTGIIAGVIIIALGINMIYKSSKEIIQLLDGNKVSNNQSVESVNENTKKTEIEKYDFTLKKGNGESITLSDFKGKTVMVTFYGTWCHYCNQELPVLEEVKNTRDDIEIILVATPNDGMEKSIDEVEKFMKDGGYTLNVVYDEDFNVKRLYQVTGYPTSYVYKPDGSMLGYLPGFMPKELLEEIIEKSKK